MISFKLTEEQEVVRDALHSFAEQAMRPIARECDEASEIPEDFLQQTWELGLVSTQIPEAFGGAGEDRAPGRATSGSAALTSIHFPGRRRRRLCRVRTTPAPSSSVCSATANRPTWAPAWHASTAIPGDGADRRSRAARCALRGRLSRGRRGSAAGRLRGRGRDRAALGRDRLSRRPREGRGRGVAEPPRPALGPAVAPGVVRREERTSTIGCPLLRCHLNRSTQHTR